MQPLNHVNSNVVSQQQIRARLFIIAVLIFISVGMIGGLLNIAWTYMQATFSVEVSAIGMLLVFATGGGLVAAFSSGVLIGRFGIGRMAALGAAVTALGLAGMVLAPTWLMLLGIIFVMYMGRGTLDAGMNNFVSERYGSVAMIWLHASWGLGLTIAPSIMTYIIITQQMSWRAGYGVMIGVTLLLLAAILFYLRQWDMDMNGSGGAAAAGHLRQRAQMRETVRQPVVLLSALLFFIYGGVEIGTGQLANTLLVESRHIDQETASLWISIYWGCFTVGRILTGVLAFRVNDELLLRGSLVLILAGAVLLIVRDVQVLSLFGLIGLGFGQAAIFPIFMSQTPRRVGLDHSGNAIGFQVGVAGFGAAVLPGLFAWSTTFFGLEALSVGILLNSILLIMIIALVVRRYTLKVA